MKEYRISPESELTIDKIIQIFDDGLKLKLSDEAIQKIEICRKYLDDKISSSSDPLYGINTGFGSLHNKNISREDLDTLQVNLVKSHACGSGEEVHENIVRLMLLLKIQSLSYGHSGIQLSTVQRLVDMFNHDVLPIIYEFGSLGASGDLAPLAHLSLPLMGLGEVRHKGKTYSGEEINQLLGWKPLSFKAKEGLALLNGTQFMSAFGVLCLIHSKRLTQLADIIGAISLDAFDGRLEPFDSLIHNIRPQAGQIETAENIRRLLRGSQLISQKKAHLQDPYSFRCIPQVHGATKDAMKYAHKVFISEINCVTDNPNIFPEEDKIISGGNFHGQPLAMAFDFMCIGLSELGNISERRTFQLVSGERNLPDFLVANPGLNSGLMIPQYTAASIVSANKQLSTPASIDSIVSSNGQEDHVSMGANAATKAYRVFNNLYIILAIELITASQALYFRKPLKSSDYLEHFLSNFREKVSFIENDRVLHEDIDIAVNFLKELKILPLPDRNDA